MIGYFTFIRPYFVYKNLPNVLAETDGEFVYFHGKKEAKISLNDLSYCYMDVDVPHIFHPGFLREFIIHKFSSDYGSITLDVPNHGSDFPISHYHSNLIEMKPLHQTST